MSNPKTCLLYVTASDKAEAETLAKVLVQEHLIACANIVDGMRSYYWWDGEVQSGAETILLLKTQQKHVEAVTNRIKSLHSYDCPCVVELPIQRGNPDFLQWIAEETDEPVTAP